jgi:hypothetical protein
VVDVKFTLIVRDTGGRRRRVDADGRRLTSTLRAPLDVVGPHRSVDARRRYDLDDDDRGFTADLAR